MGGACTCTLPRQGHLRTSPAFPIKRTTEVDIFPAKFIHWETGDAPSVHRRLRHHRPLRLRSNASEQQRKTSFGLNHDANSRLPPPSCARPRRGKFIRKFHKDTEFRAAAASVPFKPTSQARRLAFVVPALIYRRN